MRRLRPLLALAAVTSAALITPGAFAGPAKVDPRLAVSAAERHDTSAPLRDLVAPWAPSPGTVVMEAGRKAMVRTPGLVDPVQQTAASLPARARLVHNYQGLGNG